MALSKYEQETIINFNEEEKTASIYTYNTKLRNKLADFAANSTDCCLVKKGRIYSEYKVPKNWIKVQMPRQYSEEQRQKMSERAKINLAKRNKEGDA